MKSTFPRLNLGPFRNPFQQDVDYPVLKIPLTKKLSVIGAMSKYPWGLPVGICSLSLLKGG